MRGHVDTDVDALIDVMQELITDRREARRLGDGARRTALERFHIERFVRDWTRISNFTRQALSGMPITVYGDGSQTRSFCYVDDLIDALIRLMTGHTSRHA